jgi:hypothetical protein
MYVGFYTFFQVPAFSWLNTDINVELHGNGCKYYIV